MKHIVSGVVSLLLIATLAAGPAAAWSHANRYGGSTSHSEGSTSHTSTYGTSTSHTAGEGTGQRGVTSTGRSIGWTTCRPSRTPACTGATPTGAARSGSR
jgi:hypothetical protein